MSDERTRSTGQQEPVAHEPGHDDDVIELPPPKPNRGAMGVDDHVANEPLGLGHQPDDDLDRGVDRENLNSPSQGVRPGR
jgi:hypothetical protein